MRAAKNSGSNVVEPTKPRLLSIPRANFFMQHKRYVGVLKWLTLSLFAYFAVLCVVHVRWDQFLLGLVWPRPDSSKEFWLMVAAILGTTISPYLFFWQAAQEVEDTKTEPAPQPMRSAKHAAGQSGFLVSLRRQKLSTLPSPWPPSWVLSPMCSKSPDQGADLACGVERPRRRTHHGALDANRDEFFGHGEIHNFLAVDGHGMDRDRGHGRRLPRIHFVAHMETISNIVGAGAIG
jgi:Natural resistance-associated macrophage protein